MYYLGIDLGGTGIKAGIVDSKGTIIHKDRVSSKALSGYEQIVSAMAELAKKVICDAGLSLCDIASCGIGIPGAADDKNGIAYYCNNLYMKNAPIRDEFQKHLDIKTYIGNDANCAALGEFYGLGKEGVESFILITLGTGIGGGIILGGKLYTGFNGIAGEIGHINLIHGGEPCSCGRSGCWESYASATALIRDTKRAAQKYPDSYLAQLIKENGSKVSGAIPFKAASANDAAGKEVIDNYISYLGEGIVDIINIFQPEIVSIGGGICNQGDNLLLPLREYVRSRTYGAGLTPDTTIEIARLGNDAGIIGAAFLGK